MNENEPFNHINADKLAGLLPNLEAGTKANVGAWVVTPLLSGGGESPGVYRLTRASHGTKSDVPAAVILKVLAPAWPEDAFRWNFAQREYHAYGSAALQSADGLVMPRCLGKMRRPDGTAWLWMEDVADHEVWPLSRYRLAAYHLGEFNGHSARGGTVPAEFWWSRHWLRGWLEESGPAIARLGSLQHEVSIRLMYPEVDAILRLWTERDRRLELLESFPQTLCHMDVHRRNMFSRHVGGGEQTVLIDWAFVGRGAVGEDLASLVSATVAFGDVPVTEIGELESAVLAGYLKGLQDADYPADPEQVWAAYSLAASLRLPVGAVRLVLPLLLEPGQHVREQQQHERPLAELFARWSTMNRHLIALGNEAGL